MGIKSINNLLLKSAPNAFLDIPITELKGKRVAIDAPIWMHKNMATIRKKIVMQTNLIEGLPDELTIRREWLLSAINYILFWTKNDITPVFIFDGIHPIDKKEVKEERMEKTRKINEEIKSISDEMEKLDPEEKYDLSEKLRKKLCNQNYLPKAHIDMLKSILINIGIPCIRASSDGEKLCSMLCLDGIASATVSNDTDTLVYGCPLLITKISGQSYFDGDGNKISNLSCVKIDCILESLNLNQEEFKDLCILTGCDFNKGIKGVGALTAFKLITKHRRIENIPKDVTSLNHINCRSIFESCRWEDCVMKGEEQKLNFDIDYEMIKGSRYFLQQGNIEGQIESLMNSFKSMSNFSQVVTV